MYFDIFNQWIGGVFIRYKRRISGKQTRADVTNAAQLLAKKQIAADITQKLAGMPSLKRLILSLFAAQDFRANNELEDDNLRHFATHIAEWPTDYGLFNSDEFWATAMEFFFQLPLRFQRKLVELISQYR